MAIPISGHNALITVASRGIGEAVAYNLAQEGCNLLLTARNLDQVEPKATSTFTINVSGQIGWDALPNPMLDLLIKVENVTNAPPPEYETDYWASQVPGDYSVDITLSTSGEDYTFTAIPPPGFHIVGTLSYRVDDLTTDVTGIDFLVAED